MRHRGCLALTGSGALPPRKALRPMSSKHWSVLPALELLANGIVQHVLCWTGLLSPSRMVLGVDCISILFFLLLRMLHSVSVHRPMGIWSVPTFYLKRSCYEHLCTSLIFIKNVSSWKGWKMMRQAHFLIKCKHLAIFASFFSFEKKIHVR